MKLDVNYEREITSKNWPEGLERGGKTCFYVLSQSLTFCNMKDSHIVWIKGGLVVTESSGLFLNSNSGWECRIKSGLIHGGCMFFWRTGSTSQGRWKGRQLSWLVLRAQILLYDWKSGYPRSELRDLQTKFWRYWLGWVEQGLCQVVTSRSTTWIPRSIQTRCFINCCDWK